MKDKGSGIQGGCGCGQSTHAVHVWAEHLGDNWIVSKVRNFFKLLERDGMIYREKITNITRLTACNYVAYQKGEQEIDTRSTIDEQEVNKSLTNCNCGNSNGLKTSGEEFGGVKKLIVLYII